MGRIECESFGLDCPDFAEVFVGGEPLEGFETPAIIVSVDEVVEVGLELRMVQKKAAGQREPRYGRILN